MGITVSHSAMLAHCHALTQACGYTEGEQDTLYLLLKYPYFILHCHGQKHPAGGIMNIS